MVKGIQSGEFNTIMVKSGDFEKVVTDNNRKYPVMYIPAETVIMSTFTVKSNPVFVVDSNPAVSNPHGVYINGKRLLSNKEGDR